MALKNFRLRFPAGGDQKAVEAEENATPKDVLRKAGLDHRQHILANQAGQPLDMDAPIKNQVLEGERLAAAPSMDVGIA